MKNLKFRKITQFHLNYISIMLDKIVTGDINITEALGLLNEACIKNNETIIKDKGTIKRCVEFLLKDRLNELELCQKNIVHNSGKRNPRKGKIGTPKLGFYHEEEIKFKQYVIKHYLPQILEGITTFKIIEQELNCSHHTIDDIILEYYNKNNDKKGLQEYKNAKKRNAGVSLEKREEAKNKRNRILDYEIVNTPEFLLLSPKEQKLQIIMKIRVNQLKEEVNKNSIVKSAVTSEEYIEERIEKVMQFFKSKNTLDEKYFSDEEIRLMIFLYPTLIRRTSENLDKNISVLMSCSNIDEKTAYGMIKTFPTIMGYSESRIKKQLNLLFQEDLVDAVISTPRRFMIFVASMYALIQYAKERYKTSDLTEINRNNIFIANSNMKQIYGISYDEIKQKYPYIIEEKTNDKYIISSSEIIKGTYKSRSKSQEAEDELKCVILEKEGEIK